MLRKALYGLRRPPRLWWLHIHNFLLSVGFVQSDAESNLYTKPHVALLLYVDDMLLACDDIAAADEVRSLLAAKYKIKDLGEARKFVGVEITRTNNDGVLLSQKAYIDEIIERFDLQKGRAYHTPMTVQVDVDNENCKQYKLDAIHIRL